MGRVLSDVSLFSFKVSFRGPNIVFLFKLGGTDGGTALGFFLVGKAGGGRWGDGGSRSNFRVDEVHVGFWLAATWHSLAARSPVSYCIVLSFFFINCRPLSSV